MEISSSVPIQNLLSETLHEMLEIKGKHTMVAFSYPGWETSTYIQRLAFKMSDLMFQSGERLAKEKFKNFNPEKTKLTLEMLEEIWMEASKAITEERDMNKNDIGNERKAIMEKAKTVNFQDDFLRRFREKYFSYMQKTYGLFGEQSKELNREWQAKFR